MPGEIQVSPSTQSPIAGVIPVKGKDDRTRFNCESRDARTREADLEDERSGRPRGLEPRTSWPPAITG